MKNLISILLCMCCSAFVTTAHAQDTHSDVKPPLHTTSSMFGVGSANVLDTYLSPYNYTGTEVRFMHERMRPTRLLQGKVMRQTLWDINGSYLENRAATANEWAAGLRFSMGWLYDCKVFTPNGKNSSLRVAFGPAVSGYIGGVYNTRNGNNPAQAKADICIDLTAMAYGSVRLFKRDIMLRYQMTVPFIGAAFSPNYGQSYYEAFSLGHYDHNVVFAHIGNMPSMRHLLTADIPIGRNSLRIGYNGQFNQSKFNSLRYHHYSHNFLIGITRKL